MNTIKYRESWWFIAAWLVAAVILPVAGVIAGAVLWFGGAKRQAALVGVVALAAWALAIPGNAQAATIHSPSPGASVQQDASLYFDWAWTGGEYWTASITFAQTAN